MNRALTKVDLGTLTLVHSTASICQYLSPRKVDGRNNWTFREKIAPASHVVKLFDKELELTQISSDNVYNFGSFSTSRNTNSLRSCNCAHDIDFLFILLA